MQLHVEREKPAAQQERGRPVECCLVVIIRLEAGFNFDRKQPRKQALGRLETFDHRQAKVVEMRFFGGLSEDEIGAQLGISERTVKFHVSNLLSKFGVRRRADLILLCYQSRQTSTQPTEVTASA